MTKTVASTKGQNQDTLSKAASNTHTAAKALLENLGLETETVQLMCNQVWMSLMNSNLSIGAVSGIKVQFGSIVVFRSTPGIYVECGPRFGFLQPILVLIRQNKQPTTQNMARNFVGNILYTICCQHSVYSICRDQT